MFMNLKEAKNLLRENGYKLYKKERIDESFDSVYEFIETGLCILFSPFLRILAILDGSRAEDNLTLDLESVEYNIIKKILNNKFLRYVFNKIIKNDNLKEKIKNKLLEVIKDRYGYIDRYDKMYEMTNKLLDNILKKLEDNKIKQAGSLMNSVEKISNYSYDEENEEDEDY